eukprot:bmy_19405T0
MEKVGGETQKIVENDALVSDLATGFIGGIITVVVQNVSGRYSPSRAEERCPSSNIIQRYSFQFPLSPDMWEKVTHGNAWPPTQNPR